MSDPVTRLNAALEGRYAIERELGEGGMATVYLADDLKHERKVALKVLKPELAAVVGAERFLAEIKTTANLQHPHILPLFDSGEADGFLFYVMPHVEGESLRQRLDREKQLPVDDAVEITRQVARALGYAHDHNVIHRDIKPENILLAGGEAVVADFGIAKVVQAAGDVTMTKTGMALGTPAYMSPEQAAGTADLAGRSDLYGLGCVLYEMLAGQAPFTGPTVESIVRQHLIVDAPSVTVVREAVPRGISDAIRRVMAKTPADRFGTASEFVDALSPSAVTQVTSPAPLTRRRIAFAAAAVFTVTAVVAVAIIRTGGVGADAAPEDAIPSASIAVLPFVNMSSDPEQDYFSDGLAEGVLNALAHLEELHVTARSSAFSFKGQAIEVREVAARLGVAHVLEGSVQKVGDRVRITVQLIEAATDRHLWSDQFDRELSNVFAVQDEVSAAIVEALKSTMGLETAPSLRESQVVSAKAYDLYLRGLQAFGGGTTAAYSVARSYFEQAIALEPTYAVAHARLSRALFELGSEQVPSGPVREAANEAIRLDPTIGLPYTVLSMLEGREGRSLSDLTLELRTTAYELAPGDPWVTLQYGRALEARGRMPESLPLMRKAVELDPLDPEQRTVFGMFLTLRGRPAEGLREIERAIEIDPSNRRSWWTKGLASMRVVGDLVSSIEAFHMTHGLDPEFAGGASRIAATYMWLGDLEASRTWMDEAMRRGAPQSISFEAQYLLLNGQGEEALGLALREFDTQGAPHVNEVLMQIVVADMIARGALDEAERFLLRYEDRLADFMAGPVQSFLGFASSVVNTPSIALQDVYKRAGRTAEADALADRLDDESMQGRLSTLQLGWTGSNYLTEALWHMRRGRHSEALSALEQAIELGSVSFWQFFIRDYFVFEDLRETPRFKALIRTIEADMTRQREILAERTAAWMEELGASRTGR